MAIGVTALGAIFIVLIALGRGPIMPPEPGSPPWLAYAFCAISVVLVVVALVGLKPRVPERRPGQSVDQYWSDPAFAAHVTRVWFALEAAATLSALAVFMVGGPITMLAMGLAIVVFWMTGPNAFAKP